MLVPRLRIAFVSLARKVQPVGPVHFVHRASFPLALALPVRIAVLDSLALFLAWKLQRAAVFALLPISVQQEVPRPFRAPAYLLVCLEVRKHITVPAWPTAHAVLGKEALNVTCVLLELGNRQQEVQLALLVLPIQTQLPLARRRYPRVGAMGDLRALLAPVANAVRVHIHQVE